MMDGNLIKLNYSCNFCTKIKSLSKMLYNFLKYSAIAVTTYVAIGGLTLCWYSRHQAQQLQTFDENLAADILTDFNVEIAPPPRPQFIRYSSRVCGRIIAIWPIIVSFRLLALTRSN